MVYYALLSSLPMLRLDEPTYMTPTQFMEYCKEVVDPEKMRILENLTVLDVSDFEFPKGSLACEYTKWECSLRNALVQLRAARMGTDSSVWLNSEVSYDADIAHSVASAYAVTDPLEREKLLDQARWKKIEELEGLAAFSFDRICGYRLQLLLQEKWNARKAASAGANLNKAVETVHSSIK